jgi:hypothetical protein
MARLLPNHAAAALARAHRALPAPVHNAAFDDGSDLLTLAGTRDEASPGALEASHELFRETLRVTRGVRVCAVLVLWRASATHEWLTAFCAVFALDCVDVYRAVFAVASQRALMKREAWRSGAERTARDVVGLARLAALAGAVRAEATAMIDSFDPIAMALEEGNAGAYTVRQHLCGCALTAAWLALVAAAAAPKVRRVAFDGTTSPFFPHSRRSSRASSSSVSPRAKKSQPRAKDETNATKTKTKKKDGEDDETGETDDDGWCGSDRSYWSLFDVDVDGGSRERERVRFLETLGVAFAFLSRRFGPFLTSPSPGTSPAGTLARAVARAVAVVALVGSVDANARIGRE